MAGMTAGRRYRLDRSVERYGAVLLGGSPLRILRLNSTAEALLDRIWSLVASGAPLTAVTDGQIDPRQDALVDRLVGAGLLHPTPEPSRMGTGTTTDITSITTSITTVTPVFKSSPDDSVGQHGTGANVIIVDDGSDPPIAGATIRLDRNRGPAAARNAGLAAVTTPFVAFVDTDVVPQALADVERDNRSNGELGSDWLERLIGHFDDPLVALVAPRVRATPGDSLLERYEATNSPLDLGADPALVAPGSRVGYVPAAALVCRTEVIRQVGGFDESLRYGEDVDLVWRLTAAGFRCRYDPGVVLTHPPRRTWLNWWRQRVGYGTSAAALAARHGDAVAPARLNRWSILAWWVALGGPLSAAAGVAVAVGAALVMPRRFPLLPAARARKLALTGTWRAGDQLASAVRRCWWPALVVASIWSRRSRRAIVLSILATRRPIRLADDVAYSVGVWRGCLAERSLRAMVPKITSARVPSDP